MVSIELKEPSKLQSTRPSFASGMNVKYAPPILPLRISASSQPPSKAFLAKAPMSGENFEKFSSTTDRASSKLNDAVVFPTGANRS